MKRILALVGILAMAASACASPDSSPQPSPTKKNHRVDLAKPVFTNPTRITNPLNPISRLDQVIYGGQVDGKPFRTEFTRLPGTKRITWNGVPVPATTMQYLAFSDGRIQEVATDWFAQADDGSVWYFGEDVFEYTRGVVSSNEGTWQAGRDGPAAMIMPGEPKAGDVYRSENIPGLVFEEVTVKQVGATVAGPSGPIAGTMTAGELHMDGTREDKVFAPGYGEYSTGDVNGDLEQVSFAVPADARPGRMPAALSALSAACRRAYDQVGAGNWAAAAPAVAALARAWDTYRPAVPDLLARQFARDVDATVAAVRARRPATARDAVLRVAQDELDLRLRYRPVPEIDRARFELWARQLLVDARAHDTGNTAGDVATLEWTRDRIVPGLDAATARRISAQLQTLRSAAAAKDLATVAARAPALLRTASNLRGGTHG